MLSLWGSGVSRGVYSFSCFPFSIQSFLFLFLTWFMQKAYLLQVNGAILAEQFPALRGWCVYTTCRNADAAFWELSW